MTAAVSKHPRFPEAMQQFNSFMSVMLPSCAPITEHTFRENNGSERGSTPARTMDPGDSMSPLLEDAAGPYEANVELHEASRVKKLCAMSAVHRTQGDPPKANLSTLCLHALTSVTQAFETLISYLKRRRERAEQFYATITEFVQEYNSLQQDLSLVPVCARLSARAVPAFNNSPVVYTRLILHHFSHFPRLVGRTTSEGDAPRAQAAADGHAHARAVWKSGARTSAAMRQQEAPGKPTQGERPGVCVHYAVYMNTAASP